MIVACSHTLTHAHAAHAHLSVRAYEGGGVWGHAPPGKF